MAPILTTGAGHYGTVSAPTYVGPGDVTGWSSAYGYWGLRSYTAAGIGGNLIDIVDSGGLHRLTVPSDASGYISSAALSGWSGTGTMFVDKIYDQINGQTLTYPGGATRPALTLSSVGGLPAINFNGAGGYLSSAANATALAQPLTIAAISKSPTFASNGNILTDGSFNFQPLIADGAGQIGQYFGVSIQSATNVADGTFASLISVAKTTPSTLSVNGTITSSAGNAGSNGIGTTNKLTMAATDSGGTLFNGSIFEVLVQSGAVSTTNQGLLTANQRAIGTGF